MPALLAILPFYLVPAMGFAAGMGSHGSSEISFLAQIIALLVCGRLLGELMQRVGQPAVMGQLIAGILCCLISSSTPGHHSWRCRR
jgi:hypothetical protein